MEPVEFAGFGSPVGSPGNMSIGTPDNVQRSIKPAVQSDMNSPLLFRRTPAPGSNGTDSSKKFGNWVLNTSPYAGQKTPPTVSMKSMAGDENTPPPDRTSLTPDGPISSQRFQAWLKATGNTRWTPKPNASAATPPRAPAPTPAGTPMSISHEPASAASPATEEPRSRPIFDLGGSDTDSDGDETDTVVGANEVAAAAARMRAALLTAQAGMATSAPMQPAHGSNMIPITGLRAPAPSPVVSSPVPAAGSRLAQADIDSLATPMSLLSMSHGGTHSASKPQQQTPSGTWRSRLTPGRGQQAPSSPVDKVIGLMMEPEQQGALHHHHHHHHHTPSRFAAAGGTVRSSQPAPSPQQQVIQLMLQQIGHGSDQDDTEAAAAGGSQPALAEQAAEAAQHEAVHAAFGSPAEDDERMAQFYSGSELDYSSSSTESEDEIDVAELQQLVGAAGGPGTPINDIISMMLTPELKATPTFTPRDEVAAGQQPGDGVGPRVLFADD